MTDLVVRGRNPWHPRPEPMPDLHSPHKPLDPRRDRAVHSAHMPKWLLSLGKLLLVGTLMVSMGGHFALLQTIAWGNMLVSYSNEATFSEAVAKTFDGDHPCELCHVVKKSKDEEKQKPLLKSDMKLDVALPVPIKIQFPQGEDIVASVTSYTGSFGEVCLPVPVHPPRWA